MKFKYLVLLLIFSTVACQSDKKADKAYDSEIKGAVSYRDKSAIPPTSTIVVRLLDASSNEIINEYRQQADGRSIPFMFAIGYNKKDIEAGSKYVLDAEIFFAGKNLYYMLEPIEVINKGPKNDVAMILVKGPKPND